MKMARSQSRVCSSLLGGGGSMTAGGCITQQRIIHKLNTTTTALQHPGARTAAHPATSLNHTPEHRSPAHLYSHPVTVGVLDVREARVQARWRRSASPVRRGALCHLPELPAALTCLVDEREPRKGAPVHGQRQAARRGVVLADAGGGAQQGAQRALQRGVQPARSPRTRISGYSAWGSRLRGGRGVHVM